MPTQEEEKAENKRVCKKLIDDTLTENRKVLDGVSGTKRKIAREISDTGYTSQYL